MESHLGFADCLLVEKTALEREFVGQNKQNHIIRIFTFVNHSPIGSMCAPAVKIVLWKSIFDEPLKRRKKYFSVFPGK